MDHSLLNPNQLRAYGVGFWDNSYDPYHDLCITHPDLTIPLQTEGTKVFFDSQVHTEEELGSCPWIILTSENPWDPHKVRLQEININTPTVNDLPIINDNPDYLILSSISTVLVDLRPQFLRHLRISKTRTAGTRQISVTIQDLPGLRTFVSQDSRERIIKKLKTRYFERTHKYGIRIPKDAR